MKILNFIVILLSLSTFAGVVNAAIPLESDNQILGSWKLDTTKQSATSSELIEREDTWTFKNGTVTITNIPRDGGYYDQSPVKYVIEDGKLKVSVLGRAGKFEIFSLEERGENNMVLKAKYGNIYQFTKK
ncbi:hypothetical protein AU255_07135 [Methyloprofundus sedimenti]|uniref:Lipocalin-like domain-containing protein n=1 Tax=Methyloprofundus sedimenti TaxID=1420851 RepID=A0A1V8M7T8_9GAMM|nr:lipocalin family protein [Methyloprofundus sedimenti]OQK17631.1 hypothetical protein AU255_07135 [Methyloprofundus sedimenti]